MKNYETTINMETVNRFNAMKQLMERMMTELQSLYDEKTDEIDDFDVTEWEEEEFTSEQYQRYEALNRDVDCIKHAIKKLDDALDMYLA